MNVTNTKGFPSYVSTQLQPGAWKRRAAAHEHAINELVGPYLEARSRQQKDPVMDFLFEYMPSVPRI